MSRPSLRKLATVASVAALALSTLPAGAESTVTIEDLEAAAFNGTVNVDGDIEFSLDPILLEDATGDSLAPSADIASAEVDMVDDRRVKFRVTLADPLPSVGTSTVTMIRWETDQFILTAMHNRYSSPGGWSFDSQTCGEGPAGNQCSGSDVSGSYADGVIEWTQNLSSSGLTFGSRIAPAEDGLHITQTASGLVWLNGSAIDTLGHGLIELPSMDVTVTNATTGESVSRPLTRADIATSIAGSAGDEIVVEACVGGICATDTIVAS